jgi:glycosidase
MPFVRALTPLHGLSALLVAGGVVGGVLVGCGDMTPNNPDYGEPPPIPGYNPGNGSTNDPYGYGAAPTTVTCPDELKSCPYTITYADHGESTVEVRGDFGGPGTWEKGQPMAKKDGVWTADVLVPFNKPIQFKFFVDGSKWLTDPDQPTVTDATHNTNNTFAGTTCDQPRCQEEGQLPPGVFDWRDSVIYFAFVDRFFNGNPDLDQGCHVQGVSGPISDYNGGDWAGVTQKINEGYFNDLGVNTLWITVPFANPSVAGLGIGDDNHEYSGYYGYWPKLDSSDPTQLDVEKCFGTLDDLKALVSAAHSKSLKVLFDYAMVHAHNTSAIYTAHNDWFWPNSHNGSPDCLCKSKNGNPQHDATVYCNWDNDYQWCWFADYLPHWNYTNDAARAWSVANAVSWIKQTQDSSGMGADGFRADAIKHVDMKWLTDVRAAITKEITDKQSPQQRFYMVGETYTFGDRDFIKKFVEPSTKLDGQFDFPLRMNVVNALLMRNEKMSDLAAFMDSNDYFYGASAVMSTFIGNHDLPRVIHLAANQHLWDDQGNDGKDRAWQNQPDVVGELAAYERVANAFALLFTNRGAPLVYYGDEIGMPGAGDPDNRRPMKWDNLTENQQFLKDRLKTLADIRSKHPALRRGTRTTIGANADTWTFLRATAGDTVYVAINRSDSEQPVTGLPAGSLNELVTSSSTSGPTVTIPARQARIFVTK